MPALLCFDLQIADFAVLVCAVPFRASTRLAQMLLLPVVWASWPWRCPQHSLRYNRNSLGPWHWGMGSDLPLVLHKSAGTRIFRILYQYIRRMGSHSYDSADWPAGPLLLGGRHLHPYQRNYRAMHNMTQSAPQPPFDNRLCQHQCPGHRRARADAGCMGHPDSKTGWLNSFVRFESVRILKMVWSCLKMLSPSRPRE